MPVVAEKYRPPFVTQRELDSTLDDCSVVATLHGIADATSGEFVTNAYGQERGRAGLHSLARQMRRKIDGDDGGGLTIVERQEMVVDAGYPRPESVDVPWSTALGWLNARKFSLSISGNPADIKNTKSPLRRCDCAHEWFIWGACPKHDGHLIYYDGLRPWGKFGTQKRGECRPAVELRQMAFKDSDNQLNYVLKYPVGGWTRLALAQKKQAERLADLRGVVRDLRNQVRNPDSPDVNCNPKIKRALEEERVLLIDYIEQRRADA